MRQGRAEGGKMSMIRILVADDQPLMRDGLKTVLDLQKDFHVIGTARNGSEAARMADALQPDILLMDIRMPEMDGVEGLKLIRRKHPELKVIMLTTFNDDEYIIQALAAGANGYLLKDLEMEKLSEAIWDAAAGKMIMPPAVAAKLAEGLSRISLEKKGAAAAKALELSERELEIAGMMVQGFTNRQISATLYISEGTVRNYISGIYEKIGINDRTKAVLFLKDQGII
jgi:DNA-binding NarL/FixJ family response regulator